MPCMRLTKNIQFTRDIWKNFLTTHKKMFTKEIFLIYLRHVLAYSCNLKAVIVFNNLFDS